MLMTTAQVLCFGSIRIEERHHDAGLVQTLLIIEDYYQLFIIVEFARPRANCGRFWHFASATRNDRRRSRGPCDRIVSYSQTRHDLTPLIFLCQPLQPPTLTLQHSPSTQTTLFAFAYISTTFRDSDKLNSIFRNRISERRLAAPRTFHLLT